MKKKHRFEDSYQILRLMAAKDEKDNELSTDLNHEKIMTECLPRMIGKGILNTVNYFKVRLGR